MSDNSKAKTNVSPLPDDWLNLSQASGLFRLVASRTSPRKRDEKKMGRVTVHQARIFGHIFSNPDIDVSIKRLAHDLDVTPAAASQAVERLVSDGLLDRRPDPSDRRAVVITISEKGRQLLDEIKEVSNTLLADIYREINITPDEAAIFGDVLARIHGALVRRWGDYIDHVTDHPFFGSAAPDTESVEKKVDRLRRGRFDVISRAGSPGDAGILPAESTTSRAPGDAGILPAKSRAGSPRSQEPPTF